MMRSCGAVVHNDVAGDDDDALCYCCYCYCCIVCIKGALMFFMDIISVAVIGAQLIARLKWTVVKRKY